MDKLVYLFYPLLLVILLWNAKWYGKNKWNEECFSLSQTKVLQGFFTLCIMFHHLGQKTCAPWNKPKYIVHGLDFFVPIGYFFVGIFLFCSGYGLYTSYKQKPNYLKGFFGRRILPMILAYYTTGVIFLIARILMGEKMDTPQFLYYLTGLQLSNYYAWFVIALPIFYVGFYLSFRFCKKEGLALFCTALWIFVYVLIGTIVDHNPWWMRGEWWYNTAHFFVIGMLFAKYQKGILENVKRHYGLYVGIAFVAIFVLFAASEYAQAVYSYYGENFHADDKVLRRWICLVSQMGASCAFVFFVFLLGLKVQIGNKVLDFMGKVTLEFYLIHGLFVELFGYSFLDVCPSLYYIRNVPLFVVVVVVLSVPSAVLLQKLHHLILRKH